MRGRNIKEVKEIKEIKDGARKLPKFPTPLPYYVGIVFDTYVGGGRRRGEVTRALARVSLVVLCHSFALDLFLRKDKGY